MVGPVRIVEGFEVFRGLIRRIAAQETFIDDRAIRTAFGRPWIGALAAVDAALFTHFIARRSGLAAFAVLDYIGRVVGDDVHVHLHAAGMGRLDKSLEVLGSIKSLEEIYLWNSKVSKKGVENLKKSLPEAKIIY